MVNLISKLISEKVLDNTSSNPSSSARPSTSNVSARLAAPADIVDLRSKAQSIATKTDLADTTLSSGSTDPNQSSPQTVTFSVTYPGGGSITTTLNAADFEAALASNDPNALGSESSSDGSSYSVRDILREALGLNSASVSSTKTSRALVATTHEIFNKTSSSDADATNAAALLQAFASKVVGDQNQVGKNFNITLNSPSKTGSIAIATLAGIQDGVSFSISLTPQPAATAVTGLDIRA